MKPSCALRVVLALLAVLAAAPPAVADRPREFNTRHYRIITDLDPILADDCGRRMDQMHEQYVRRLSDFIVGRPDAPRFTVRLFRKQADYLRHTGTQFRNTGGVFMSGRNELAAFLEGQGRDALRRTLQHEAFHQFAHTYIHPNMPVWLNEGMAQVFEEGIWTGRDFMLNQAPPRRIRQLRADLQARRLIPFETMTRMTPGQWAANLEADHELGATQYNQSWAMVHFLVTARDNAGRERYRNRLMHMLHLLHAGKSGEQAFTTAFFAEGQDIDVVVKNFQQRFTEFAKGLDPTPQATLIENQGVLADLLAELASRGQRFDTMLDFKRAAVRGRYRLHYTRGQLKWHSDANPANYFSDLSGRPFEADQLYLASRPSAPLPDIVCRLSDKAQLRTRFYTVDGKTEHEVLMEGTGASVDVRAQ